MRKQIHAKMGETIKIYTIFIGKDKWIEQVPIPTFTWQLTSIQSGIFLLTVLLKKVEKSWWKCDAESVLCPEYLQRMDFINCK